MRTFPPSTRFETSFKAASFKKVLLAAAVAAALGTAAPVFAQDAPPAPMAAQHCDHHGHQGWKHHRGMKMMRNLHQLDLSDAQKQSIHTAFKSSRAGMRTQFEGLMQQRRAFETAVPGTLTFNTAYGSYAQAAAVVAQARVKAEADLRVQIYNLLTEPQRAKLATLQAQHQHPSPQSPQG